MAKIHLRSGAGEVARWRKVEHRDKAATPFAVEHITEYLLRGDGKVLGRYFRRQVDEDGVRSTFTYYDWKVQAVSELHNEVALEEKFTRMGYTRVVK